MPLLLLILVLLLASCDEHVDEVVLPPAVARLSIERVDTIAIGNTVTLVAKAYDSAGVVIPGIQPTWISRDTALRVTATGAATGVTWSKRTWIVAQNGNARDSIAVVVVRKYRVVDLGTLGGPDAEATAMAGEYIVGWSITPTGARHAFRWRAGTMTDLGTLGGAASTAHDVNADGVVVGESQTAAEFTTRAFVYRNGAMSDLGTLGGRNSVAYSIDASGTRIVGGADSIQTNCPDIITCSTYPRRAAVLWANGEVRVLRASNPNPFLQVNMGAGGGSAFDISGDRIVGKHELAALSWDPGGTEQILALGSYVGAPARVTTSHTAWRITADGTIIGWTEVSAVERVVRGWIVKAGQRIELSEPGVYDYHYIKPNGINASGEIVGEGGSNLRGLASCDCATLWWTPWRYDLNPLAGTSIRITTAVAIDDAHRILANGVTADGRKRALLLEPLP